LQSIVSDILEFYIEIYQSKLEGAADKEKKQVDVLSFIVETLLLLNSDSLNSATSKREYQIFSINDSPKLF
jgi:hypothetical protein